MKDTAPEVAPVAIPGCQPWREKKENRQEDGTPAEVCPSAYCQRCAQIRATKGRPAILPNDWTIPEEYRGNAEVEHLAHLGVKVPEGLA